MQLESEVVSLEKPQLDWGNHKIPASYTLVGQGLVLKNGAILVDG
jgi:hypothetical protein